MCIAIFLLYHFREFFGRTTKHCLFLSVFLHFLCARCSHSLKIYQPFVRCRPSQGDLNYFISWNLINTEREREKRNKPSISLCVANQIWHSSHFQLTETANGMPTQFNALSFSNRDWDDIFLKIRMTHLLASKYFFLATVVPFEKIIETPRLYHVKIK